MGPISRLRGAVVPRLGGGPPPSNQRIYLPTPNLYSLCLSLTPHQFLYFRLSSHLFLSFPLA